MRGGHGAAEAVRQFEQAGPVSPMPDSGRARKTGQEFIDQRGDDLRFVYHRDVCCVDDLETPLGNLVLLALNDRYFSSRHGVQ